MAASRFRKCWCLLSLSHPNDSRVGTRRGASPLSFECLLRKQSHTSHEIWLCNVYNEKEQQETEVYHAALPLSSAVRTGLEPATSGVTGRHSNQLNYRTFLEFYPFLEFRPLRPGFHPRLRVQNYNIFHYCANFSATFL